MSDIKVTELRIGRMDDEQTQDITNWVCFVCKSHRVYFIGEVATAMGQALDHNKVECTNCGEVSNPWPAEEFTAKGFMKLVAEEMDIHFKSALGEGFSAKTALTQAGREVLARVADEGELPMAEAVVAKFQRDNK